VNRVWESNHESGLIILTRFGTPERPTSVAFYAFSMEGIPKGITKFSCFPKAKFNSSFPADRTIIYLSTTRVLLELPTTSE
jgi:hypothetical protein